MKARTAASFISYALTPVITGLILMTAIFRQDQITEKLTLTGFLISFIFVIILPTIFNIYLLKTKRITNFHLKIRKERLLPFSFALVSTMVALLALYLLGIPIEAMMSMIIFWFICIVFLLITTEFKISGHMFVFVFSVLYIGYFINPRFLILLLLGFPLGWSRLKLKEHTPKEVLAGTLYAMLSFLVLRSLI